MSLSLKERFERLGPSRVLDRVQSGSPAVVALRVGPDPARVKTVAAAISLCRRGITMLRAKRAMEEMLTVGRAVLSLPVVEDSAVLAAELFTSGVVATTIVSPDVDVRAVRERLGLTQEQFSLRYGFDLASIQSWEAGRSSPDTAARSYLRVIERIPEQASQALEDAAAAS